MQSRGSQVQLPSFCRRFYATARHLRRSPATLTIILIANSRANLASYHLDLLAARTHTSTTPHVGVMGACRLLHTLRTPIMPDVTLQCMLGRDVVLFYLPSHARRPVISSLESDAATSSKPSTANKIQRRIPSARRT
jgi:hypothetical protein